MQSVDFGFSGLVKPAEPYALNSNVPWENWSNPGPTHVGIDGTLDETGQRIPEKV